MLRCPACQGIQVDCLCRARVASCTCLPTPIKGTCTQHHITPGLCAGLRQATSKPLQLTCGVPPPPGHPCAMAAAAVSKQSYALASTDTAMDVDAPLEQQQDDQEDLYTLLKTLQRQLEFFEIQVRCRS